MITIDLGSTEPVFRQLITQIKGALEREQLYPGDALPSIRQLAADLEINAKTVAKAYQLLERDNIIESKGYRGSFVRADALKYLSLDLKQWLTDALFAEIKNYRLAGALDSEIRGAFNQALANVRSEESLNNIDTEE